MKLYPKVTFDEVRNMPNLTKLQGSVETYIKSVAALSVAPRCEMGIISEKNKFRVIGNPFRVVPDNLKDGHKLHVKGIPSKYLGHVACPVLNAEAGWDEFHFFEDEGTAEEFFDTTAATNKGDYMLINAHKKDGSDAVHEIFHSYHGSDGRFDWLFNEGLTDWFAMDFADTIGTEFNATPGSLYTAGRNVVKEVIDVAGKMKVAKLFFTSATNPKFQAYAKKMSKVLMEWAQYDGSPKEFRDHYKRGPQLISSDETAEAAKLIK